VRNATPLVGSAGKAGSVAPLSGAELEVRQERGTAMAPALAGEFFTGSPKRPQHVPRNWRAELDGCRHEAGNAVRKREETHKMAESEQGQRLATNR